MHKEINLYNNQEVEELKESIKDYNSLLTDKLSVKVYPRSIEQAFQQEYHRITANNALIQLWLGFWAFAISCLFDLFFLENGTSTIKIRLFLISPILLLLIGICYTKYYQQLQQQITTIFAIVAISGLVIISAMIPVNQGIIKEITYASVVLCPLFVTTLGRIQFRYAIVVFLVTMLLFNISFQFSGMEVSSEYYPVLVAQNYVIFSGAALCVIFSYINESSLRRQFISDCLVDKKNKLNEALNEDLKQEVEDRKQAEEKVVALSNDLVLAARQAGMSDIATSILHNVGNILNSVNISIAMINEKIQQSKMADLSAVIDLMEQHMTDMNVFITQDERGKNIPRLLPLLVKVIAEEKAYIVNESLSLEKNVGHIKEIMAMQQSLSVTGGMVETIVIKNLINDALTIAKTSYEKIGIIVEREFADIEHVMIDRVKLLQIIVNIVKNAVDSLLISNSKEKK